MSDNSDFAKQLLEMYQGEVVGEVLFNIMLRQYPDAEHQFKSATMLQLETETKARLRPALIALGADLTEEDASRNVGQEFAASIAGKDWLSAMAILTEGITPYVDRYREIAENAPSQYKEIALSMVEHEASLQAFVSAEAGGDGDEALRRIEQQLSYPLR
jgi:hypothetical protein